MQMTKDNYRQSWGQGKDFTVAYVHKPLEPVGTYFEECCRAAELVYAQRTAPLKLMYGGGLDGEYALSVFRHLGIPITPCIMQTAYNYHDTLYAYRFLESRNIAYERVDLDYDLFVKSGRIVDIALQAETSTVGCLANLWMTQQLDGDVLTGDAPPYIRLNQQSNTWMVGEAEYEAAQFRYWQKMGTTGTPFFMGYTTEQWCSFLIDPVTVSLANHQRPGKLGSNTSKCETFNRTAPFTLEPRPKYHGMEQIERSAIYQHEHCRLIESWTEKWGGWYEQPYHELMISYAEHQTEPWNER